MARERSASDRGPLPGAESGVSALLGASEATLRLRREIRDLAAFEAPVLIVGETGVGKELVARSLHACSPRADRPLEVVNCGGLSGELLAAELFGHREGSFTGARRDRQGRILAARSSSLLLDEVSETPPSLQVALLRAVEYGEIQPVGSDHRVGPVDVRYLATSNRPIEELRTGTALRADLFHRLAALLISIPPLRERPEDIDVLAEHFLGEMAQRHGRRRHLAPAGLELLRRHPFPGNVRELRHVLLQAYARAGRDRLDAEEIADALGRAGGPAAAGRPAQGSPPLALQAVIRNHIRFVIRLADGNLSRAARLMELPRSTLQHYLVKYGVEEADARRRAGGNG